MKTQKKRRKVTITKPKVKNRLISRRKSFHDSLERLNRDFTRLLKQKEIDASDVRVLHRVALDIQNLYFDARQLKHFPKYQESTLHIIYTLTTPWGAPFVMETTLLEAAENFSEQEPKRSDLRKWMSKIVRYGHHFPSQILDMIHD